MGVARHSPRAWLHRAAACCCFGALGEVMGSADQHPFLFHRLNAAEQELLKPSCPLDLTKDGFDDLLA